MIVLMGFTFGRVILGASCVSLAVLVFIIAYRKLLKYLGRGTPNKEEYCVLHELEIHPAKGEVEFYFTSDSKRKVTLELLNDDLSFFYTIQEKDIIEGGTIVRFDTKKIPNGTYFYQLRTDNQKTMKRFTIEN